MSPLASLLTYARTLTAALPMPLAPCPFCGSTKVTLYGAPLFRCIAVLCLGCAARGPEAETDAAAASRWRYCMRPPPEGGMR
jgi:Lar family restriction alleviation protein